MSKKKALLMEVISIQDYIFSSNKLRMNTGASHLVEKTFNEYLQKSLGMNEEDFNRWKKEPDIICTDNGKDTEVGYIGGGNALILFNKEEDLRKAFSIFSDSLLVQVPGLKIAAVAGEIDFDNFQESRDDLFDKLMESRIYSIPVTEPVKMGFTADCPLSNAPASVWNSIVKSYVSYSADARLKASKEAHEKFSLVPPGDSSEMGKKGIQFPVDIDDLGQSEGDNHIAVVHIDGNSIGKEFKKMNTLKELRETANKLATSVTERSFRDITERIQKLKSRGILEDIGIRTESFPMRPILIGGDDVTFVCDARLALFLSKEFIKSFESHSSLALGRHLTACAGVAIAGTNYPFSRIYELSEELCSSAKVKSRENGGQSAIDFYILYSGKSGDLSSLREKHFRISDKEYLSAGPYLLNSEEDNWFGFKKLESIIEELSEMDENGEKKWPRNKVKALREALSSGEAETNMFLTEIKFRGLKLPDDSLWQDGVTPYFDAVEMLEYYPMELKG